MVDGKNLAYACARFMQSLALPAQDPGMTSVSTAIDVQPTRLLANPIGENWLSYNGDYTGRRTASSMKSALLTWPSCAPSGSFTRRIQQPLKSRRLWWTNYVRHRRE